MTEIVNDGEPMLLEKYAPVDYTTKDWLKYEGVFNSDELKTIYSVSWSSNQMVSEHMRTGKINLSLIKHNFFTGSRGFFENIEFLRDGNVTGFRVSNGRVRDLLFKRQPVEE